MEGNIFRPIVGNVQFLRNERVTSTAVEDYTRQSGSVEGLNIVRFESPPSVVRENRSSTTRPRSADAGFAQGPAHRG